MSQPIPIIDVFDLVRIPSSLTGFILLLYFPLGCAVFVLRVFLGVHAFIVACLLRKSTALRSLVLRVMCALLGLVVRSESERSSKVKIICANHVSALDHLAVDLVQPCILPSVWDIPSILRWCFGYADLGARSGRGELVRQAKNYIETEDLPLLAFPEGAITSGQRALLKFSSWPCEVADQVQPLSITMSRPLLPVRIAVLGSAWWADVFWFLILPFTIVKVRWLPVLTRMDDESTEDFSFRIERSIATDLGLQMTNLTHQDAVDAAKRYLSNSVEPIVKRQPMDTRRMDEIAMRIKQSHPSIALLDIRLDLEQTKDQQKTIERIRTGKLVSLTTKLSDKFPSDPAHWKKTYTERKWNMIEINRAKYLNRLNRAMDSGD